MARNSWRFCPPSLFLAHFCARHLFLTKVFAQSSKRLGTAGLKNKKRIQEKKQK
jgi:hypothetical protein